MKREIWAERFFKSFYACGGTAEDPCSVLRSAERQQGMCKEKLSPADWGRILAFESACKPSPRREKEIEAEAKKITDDDPWIEHFGWTKREVAAVRTMKLFED